MRAVCKMDIQVWLSHDVMVFMGARDVQCKVVIGHVDHWFGGHARILHGKGVCGWLQEDAGSPAPRHQPEQRFVKRGHLDHQTDGWQATTTPGKPAKESATPELQAAPHGREIRPHTGHKSACLCVCAVSTICVDSTSPACPGPAKRICILSTDRYGGERRRQPPTQQKESAF